MNDIRILLYHSVDDVDLRDSLGIRIEKEKFESQVRFLKENKFNVWTLKETVDCIKKKRAIPPRTVAITFDDGYRDNIINAAPVLETYGFRGTFFVTVDYIGGVKTSQERKWQRWECMGQDDLLDLIKRGHDIGSHSLHHLDLRTLDGKMKREELRVSKDKLESFVKRTVDLFSYPYGYFDEELSGLLKDEKYTGACTTIAGPNTHTTDVYKLRRTEIVNRDTPESFGRKLEESACRGREAHLEG